MSDPRFTLCICPGCGWTGPRRPVEEADDNAAESFCTDCGYTCDAEPWRLPSVDEIVSGNLSGHYDSVDLSKFIPALLRALAERGAYDPSKLFKET